MGGIPDLDKIRCVVSAKLELPEPHVAGRKRGYGALPVALVEIIEMHVRDIVEREKIVALIPQDLHD